MALKIEKVDVWSGIIRDVSGGLAAVVGPLVAAGADFSFLIARRQPDRPGSGIVFLGGLKGAKQTKAAQSVGLSRPADVSCLRVEAPDKPGLAQMILTRLSAAGINLRGVSASVIAKRCVLLLAFETAADRDTAVRHLRA
jgi:hypothetical protein